MASNKKLFTVTVEDQYSSQETDLLNAANEAAFEYAAIYNWSDISVSKSSLPIKKNNDVTIHYFDVFGKGEAVEFSDPSTNSPNGPTDDGLAAKDANM